ncbi:TIR-NBS-LRR type disease resistance protein, putative [Medicago truncatula]|uniref:TIR-NBS-LRR type disease resistance protein, putative n=2 Tax=Medicago truncatula TaxID=3880 RepID=G7ZVL3_MEDTR|nr:TIR-NBS-LRR type disease resistance protein, putative [Medicago truncatula]
MVRTPPLPKAHRRPLSPLQDLEVIWYPPTVGLLKVNVDSKPLSPLQEHSFRRKREKEAADTLSVIQGEHPIANTKWQNHLPLKQTHEVLLSFRGEDTHKTFKSHLNSALRRLDIKTYIEDNLVRGDEISQPLLKAIDEILECRKNKGQMILPVFYEVDPFHVRHQLGSYAEAFIKHEQRFGSTMNVLQKWRDALGEAANHSGTEAELVEEIAMDVLQKLKHVYVRDLDHQITKLVQLAQLQLQYYKSIDTYENQLSHEATVQRITELKMKRSVRMLRLTHEMLSYMKDSEAYEKLF